MSSPTTAIFQQLILDKYDLMDKKRADNPNLIIPKNFKTFIQSPLFLNFLKSIYEYGLELNKIEIKQKVLEEEAKDRVNAQPQLLNSEITKVNEKLIKISEFYSIILLKQGSFNVMYKDQNFFETLIFFTTQVLKELFDRQEFKTIEEEINRIFRTETFNLIKRKHFEDEKQKQYPVLKEYSVKDPIEQIIARMEKRSRVPKMKYKHFIMKEKSEIKPYYIKSSAYASVGQRSPMVAMVLPSAKERLFQQEKQRKKRQISLAFRVDLSENEVSNWMTGNKQQQLGKSNMSELL